MKNQSSAGGKENKTFSLLSPLALKIITLKNCSVSWKNGQQQHSIQLNGRFSLNFNQQGENQHLFTGISGEIDLTGALPLRGQVSLQVNQEDSYLAQIKLKSDDISHLKGLATGLEDMELSGKLDLKSQARFKPSH
ncbi:MAG: hypothetical protein GY786_03795, partial [Proteobacteria bacterium]|nr:hypothetical protein [Pseudomonadota bacterium]